MALKFNASSAGITSTSSSTSTGKTGNVSEIPVEKCLVPHISLFLEKMFLWK
ncbi:hypothetical protein TorRG33x02_216840 [Trema orientale]|uniref:Uncharacterized protein n=1 Tax=Trema orientale TaxID=63057 RepID=A0A2P5EAL1_TREOI|nr:hypothetical protein TorRG33x02_216840 [Trema orientale]